VVVAVQVPVAPADQPGMTTAAHEPPVHADPSHDALGLTAMLPPRAAVLERLGELLPGSAERSATLLVVGLRRPDDGWPIPAAALDEITVRLARGLRAGDWLARSGPTEFAVLVRGPLSAAEGAARRMVESIDVDPIRQMTAAAGLAALEPGLLAGEVLRRATLCLSTARGIGAGRVITYSGTR
jgi:hypothetical protein